MGKVEMLKNILLEEYGIATDKELEKAIRETKKINIGIFTTCAKEELPKGVRKGA